MEQEQQKQQSQEQNKAEQKEQQSQQEVQKQIDELNRHIKSQSEEDKTKNKQEELNKKKQEQERLQKEADIKKALSSAGKEDIDLDDLSNKEILDIIADAFDTSIEARTKIALEQAEEQNKGLVQKLENLEQYLLKKEASEGINNARSKFRDFDDYKEDISKVFEEYPGISPEDAYRLAKGRKSEGSPKQNEVETEKPISLGTRAEAAEKRHKEKSNKKEEAGKQSRRQFKQSVLDAAEKVINSREH